VAAGSESPALAGSTASQQPKAPDAAARTTHHKERAPNPTQPNPSKLVVDKPATRDTHGGGEALMYLDTRFDQLSEEEEEGEDDVCGFAKAHKQVKLPNVPVRSLLANRIPCWRCLEIVRRGRQGKNLVINLLCSGLKEKRA
jgi:hypothetical protein